MPDGGSGEPPAGAAERQRAGERVLAERLAPHLVDHELLHLALTHRSYCAEVPGEESNERLEFLGDAVLELVVTEHLYATNPDLPEGDLARIRAAVVSTRALAPIAARLGVGEALYLGRGEEASGGRDKASLLADALESIIGATYLAADLSAARDLVLRLLETNLVAESARTELGDAKNRLQELASRLGLERPEYSSVARGPDHDRRFVATVTVGEVRASGEGRARKIAEQQAAEGAIAELVSAREHA